MSYLLCLARVSSARSLKQFITRLLFWIDFSNCYFILYIFFWRSYHTCLFLRKSSACPLIIFAIYNETNYFSNLAKIYIDERHKSYPDSSIPKKAFSIVINQVLADVPQLGRFRTFVIRPGHTLQYFCHFRTVSHGCSYRYNPLGNTLENISYTYVFRMYLHRTFLFYNSR